MAGTLPPSSPSRLAALAGLDDLEALAEAFARRAGYEPEALSHWDPKPEHQREIEGWLAGAVSKVSPVPYAYSGYLDLDDATLRTKLGENPSRGLVATSGGTASIAVVASFLKSVGVRSVHVVTPAYFAFEALCDNLGIATTFAPIGRLNGVYRLPPPPGPAPDAVWLTSPVFGASEYLDLAAVGAWIDGLPSATLVVVDESLAFLDRGCLAAIASTGRVIRITTPNKALCINGEKVSFVSAPRAMTDALDGWSECLAGGIGASGLHALSFLRSPAFDAAVVRCRALLGVARERFDVVLADVPGCSIDRGTDGHFVMVYWPTLSMDLLRDEAFLTRIMTETGATVIPASRNRHPEEHGLSFRVNLLRLDDAGLGALRRLALFFDAGA